MGPADLTGDNQLAAAESLLDLVNSDIQVLRVKKKTTRIDPLAKTKLETVVTSVHATKPIKKINLKRRQPLPEELCQVVTIKKNQISSYL